jgi:hypothetical protein
VQAYGSYDFNAAGSNKFSLKSGFYFFLYSTPWVGFSVNIAELIHAMMGVYLGCCETAVAQQFLDGVKICPVSGEMRGETVPEHVRALFTLGGNQ